MSIADLLERLDAVEERLAARAVLQSVAGALTDADPGSGERWDAGQVWAHVAEFIPYWIEQIRLVRAPGGTQPVPFGRTHGDAGRIAAIERDRGQPVSVLWSDVHAHIESLRELLKHLDVRDREARGVHPTRGVMDVDRIVDEFLVGHLEEHADQLDSLASGDRSA